MAKSLEDIISDTVNKAVKKAMADYRAQIRADVAGVIRQELASLNTAATVEEKLLTRKDAAARLIVSVATLDDLVAQGEIAQVKTPNGRNKIAESSLNAYIRRLRG